MRGTQSSSKSASTDVLRAVGEERRVHAPESVAEKLQARDGGVADGWEHGLRHAKESHREEDSRIRKHIPPRSPRALSRGDRHHLHGADETSGNRTAGPLPQGTL